MKKAHGPNAASTACDLFLHLKRTKIQHTFPSELSTTDQNGKLPFSPAVFYEGGTGSGVICCSVAMNNCSLEY